MKAFEIAQHLKGKRNGNRGWLICCPAHGDKTASLSIKDSDTGRLLVHCFSGCPATDVLAAFRSLGYLEDRPLALQPYIPPVYDRHNDELVEKRRKWALGIWQASVPATGTIVETYLRSRGCDGPVCPTLRYNERLRHPDGESYYPGMVAAIAIAPSNSIIAIHRTFLREDGGAKADTESQKAMLGEWRGGAVRLASAGDSLVVGEGIETTLSAMQILDMPGWAGLSASGIENMILPDSVRRVVLCADRDKLTPQHPRGHGIESCEKAAERWRGEGREVTIRLPPDGLKDFNDLLRRREMPHP